MNNVIVTAVKVFDNMSSTMVGLAPVCSDVEDTFVAAFTLFEIFPIERICSEVYFMDAEYNPSEKYFVTSELFVKAAIFAEPHNSMHTRNLPV